MVNSNKAFSPIKSKDFKRTTLIIFAQYINVTKNICFTLLLEDFQLIIFLYIIYFNNARGNIILLMHHITTENLDACIVCCSKAERPDYTRQEPEKKEVSRRGSGPLVFKTRVFGTTHQQPRATGLYHCINQQVVCNICI